VTRRVPWYRRLLPRRRAAAAGERHAPVRTASAGSLVRTFLLTVLVVLLVGGLLAYATVPNLRQAVNRQVDAGITQLRHQLGAGFVQVHAVGVTATSELTGHPAKFAADLINNDYWAADTARDPQPTLVFSFDGRTDLDFLVITSGASGGDFARLARPKTVQLVYSDGTGETLTLKDDPKPVTYNVHARRVTSMGLKVMSVYPVSGNTAVGLTEVEFSHLK
jgi:type II secretory pathway pseudopilin PulG